MKEKHTRARLTLWVSRLVALALLALAVWMPRGANWYASRQHLPDSAVTAILAAFYSCTVFVGICLVMVDKLLRSILDGQVFTRKNVRLIRIIHMCTLFICLICLVAAVWYLPLLFGAVITAFLWLMVGVMADVMGGAVQLREETDLTI